MCQLSDKSDLGRPKWRTVGINRKAGTGGNANSWSDDEELDTVLLPFKELVTEPVSLFICL